MQAPWGALFSNASTFDSYRICLQANIDRQARKLEEVRAQPHAPGPQGKAAKQKKIDKLDKAIKQQMAKELGGVRMKQTFLVSHL